MADDIPQWAKERVRELCPGHFALECVAFDFFARYIAEHEEPPVDPLVSKLDEICRDAFQAYDFCGVGFLKRLEASGLKIVEAEKGKSHGI